MDAPLFEKSENISVMKGKNNIADEIAPREIIPIDFEFGVVRIRVDGIPLFANNSFFELLGFNSFDEMLLHFQLNEEFKKCFSPLKYSSHLKRESGSVFFENRWIKKNGQSVLLRENVRASRDEAGTILHFDCFVEDVTNNVIIEKLIKDIEAGDYSILKALPDLIFVLSGEGKFIDYQSNYHKLFIDKEHLKGLHVSEVFPEIISGQIVYSIKTALNSGNVEMFEFNLESESETEYFEARFAIAGHNLVLMILRDISTQKLAEIQIKNFTEKLKHLNITKDKFFSIISHDLRTPITGLLGYSELLSKEIETLDKDEIKHFAGNIAEIAKSTNTLLSNILDWSRIQTGRVYFSPQTTDIFNAVKRVLNLLAGAASNKNIAFDNKVEESTILYADENMLQSVLINLVGNAIKFTNAGGTVRIECEKNETGHHFQVADNGIGIDKADLQKLFDSDIIFSTNGTAKENGTGLGLLLCKEFVEKHYGKIWVESEKGKGTTFHFTIPPRTNI